jgi:peptidoglycan hydrolase CwlO-like protein
MAEGNDDFSRRLDQYMNLMVDLRVSQVMTDKQISQLSASITELRETTSDLRETVSAMLPVVLKQQESIDAHAKSIDAHAKSIDAHAKSIDTHSKNIEDLYRSQGHFLRRLFGEDNDPSQG